MGTPKADIRAPWWPRLLSRDLAATYVGLSPSAFDTRVSVAPIKLGKRVLFDRFALDRWIDAQAAGPHPDADEDWLGALDEAEGARR